MENIVVEIPLEEAFKIKKNKKCEKSLLTLFTAGVSNQCMPSQHHPDKCCVAAWIPRALYSRLKKRAKELKMSITEVFEYLIIRETKNIELTAEDYEEIARQTRRASQRTSNKRLQKKDKPLG